ncbi:capsular polysaccharide biosynthesis protein [Pasteurellaceae bacterium LIM206]|nr:capsular polysaccharide biosynthesis protein [Pasteurellaceae bacterium LIM206]
MFFSTLGLFRQRHQLFVFLDNYEKTCFLIWGRKHYFRVNIAQKCGINPLFLEDGFLRSLGLGVNGYPPLSLVYDDIGIYYDTTRPSRLERLILAADLTENELNQAELAMKLICRYQLSKYNHTVRQAIPATAKPIVLVVDQTFGDMAVRYGQADEQTFARMLSCAIAENPQAEIWVKIHPDVLSGKKKGYFNQLVGREDLHFFGDEVNPIALLEQVEKVYCVTSQLGFEALLVGKPVVTFGVPWYAGWGLTDDRHSAIVQLRQNSRRSHRTLPQLFACAYLQYSRYLNPNTQKRGSILDVIDYLAHTTRLNRRLAGDLYCIGMSLWKRAVIKPFFQLPGCRLHFVSQARKLPAKLPQGARLLLWGNGKAAALDIADQRHIPVLRMEDGFIRSVGLGSNLVAPLSLVIDDLGIYFNPQTRSRLEQILNEQQFSPQDLNRAEALRQALVTQHIGKYNVGESRFRLNTQEKLALLVTGQVEDDASIRFGSPELSTNLALLQQVRKNNPHAYIVYKPHPDIISGNRIGDIPTHIARQYADEIVERINILDCILAVDEVHTMTSLAGFEALLRGKKVYCYGLPFYAGWGLTTDTLNIPRRTRKLSLQELIAGTLIYYPQYIDPVSRQIISPERAIEVLRDQREKSQKIRIKQNWLKKQCNKIIHLYNALTA